MTVQTVRPNEESINNGGAYAATGGGGSLAAVTSDNSDATYMVGSNTGTVVLGYGTVALTAGQRIRAARGRVRALGPGLGTNTVFVWWTWGNFTDGDWHPEDVVAVSSGPTTLTGAYHTSWAGGGEITQADLNKIQMKVRSSVAAGTTGVIFEESIDVDILSAPTVTATAPTGTNPGATHHPTAAWTSTIGDGYPQKAFRIKVFDKAVNVSPVWGNTIGLVYDTGRVAGTATSHVMSGLTFRNSDYRLLVEVMKDFNGDDWTSATSSIDFTINDNPPVPTLIGPTGTIKSGFPNLQAKVAKSVLTASTAVYAEWQVATDAGFGTNVRLFNETIHHADNGGVHYYQTAGVPLDQTTWFVRARTHDSTGGVSAWSAAVTFTVAHVPTARPVSPLAGAFVANTFQIFLWDFVAWAPTETQTAFQLLVVDSVGATLVDTGKVVSANTNTITTVTTEQAAAWQVRVWDDSDIPSVYSDLINFSIVSLPDVQFTFPLDGTVITSSPATVTTAFTSSVGRTQVSYHLTVLDEDSQAVVYDSGVVVSAATSFLLPEILVSGHTYTFAINVVDSAGSPSQASASGVQVLFAAPAAPTGLVSETVAVSNRPLLTGLLAVPTFEVVYLAWDPTGIGDHFASYDVFRFDTLPGTAGQWNRVASLTDEGQPFWYDAEPARAKGGYLNSYYVVVVDTVAGPSLPAQFADVTVAVSNDTDLVFSSNWTPDLSVAYQDEGPYDFGTNDAAGVKVAEMFGQSFPSAFRAPNRKGDVFGRTLIVAAHDPNVSALDSGRAMFDPLLARIRDTDSPYVCVADGMGRKWFVSLTFVKGSYRKSVEHYLADVGFQEVADVPVAVTTSVAWVPS